MSASPSPELKGNSKSRTVIVIYAVMVLLAIRIVVTALPTMKTLMVIGRW